MGLDILIAGAGIGGLSAALCLQQAGHKVRVLERADRLVEVGAGVQCGANATRVLWSLGLQESIEACAVAPKRVLFRDYIDGRPLHQMHLGSDYKARFGAPYLHIHRADLQQVLAAAFSSAEPGGIHLNAEVSRFQESESGVEVQLADGRSIHGDLLIAADGIRSTVRDQLIGSLDLKWTGHVAWRGLVPVDQLPADFMDKEVSNYAGPGKHMVLYYVSGQAMVNFVGVVEHPDWCESSWVSKAPWSELRDDFAGWHPRVQQLIHACRKDECYRWALYQTPELERWCSDRVVLLGDAAHATLPYMAAGGAMAIEDARILQRCLEDTDSITEALGRYQRSRQKRTGWIQKQSALLGHLYHLPTRPLRQIAFAGMRLMSARSERRLAGYDANQVPLA